MQYERAISTLVRNGFEVQRLCQKTFDTRAVYESGFVARRPQARHEITAIKQGDRALCLNVKPQGEQADAMTDYFPGVYCKTLKNAMALAD